MILRAVTATAALGLTTLELIGRRSGDRLPEARIWHDPVAQVKHRALLRRRSRGLSGGVVFAGSSQVLEGIKPSLAAPELGPRTYNVALHRGFLPLTEPWLLDVVLPLAAPDLVVLGLSVLDLNDNGIAQHEVLGRFENAPARRPGRRAALIRGVHRRSAVARVALTCLMPTLRRTEVRVGPEGQGTEFAEATEYRLSERKRDYIEQELLADYRFGPQTAGRLERVVEGIRDTGAEVVFVEMPVTRELVDMLPGRDRTFGELRGALRQESRRLAVRLIDDLDVMVHHRWFADCVHLNGLGMAEASRILARALGDDRRAVQEVG